MGAFLMAWLFGEGVIIYRAFKVQGGPPWPGQLLAGTGAFAALAILAEMGADARKVALTAAWGLNAAAFLALFPQAASYGVTGPWANKVTGTDPKNMGWWDQVTSQRIPDTSLLPANGGCVPVGQEGGSQSGSSGKCPPGFTYFYGLCLPPAWISLLSQQQASQAPATTTPATTTTPAKTAPGTGTVLV